MLTITPSRFLPLAPGNPAPPCRALPSHRKGDELAGVVEPRFEPGTGGEDRQGRRARIWPRRVRPAPDYRTTATANSPRRGALRPPPTGYAGEPPAHCRRRTARDEGTGGD